MKQRTGPMFCRPWLALVLLTGCGTAATIDVDGGLPDDAARAPDTSVDAPRCGPCDDGDATTTDACVVDHCEHRRCASDAACDDADIDTGDHCVLDRETATWSCGHTTVDGTCASDADCFDGIDCTRDVCATANRCRHTWIPGCVGMPADTLVDCPASATEGGDCAVDAITGLNYDCRVGDDACADWFRCIGNTFGTHYVRVQSVRDGCDAGGCPSSIPSGLCTPDLYCDYGTGLAPGRVYCDCWDRHDATIAWDCVDDAPCPLSPPADGSAVDHVAATSSTDCYYGDETCHLDPSTWTWMCRTSIPMFCPPAAPATGDTCDLASECGYDGPVTPSDPVTTYRGDCTCDGTHWSCTPSESADCPSTQPRPFFAGDLCMPSAGNRGCWYPPPAGSDLWTQCHCDGPSGLTELWTCDASAHF